MALIENASPLGMNTSAEISFDEPDWLISHHRAKEAERRDAIVGFDIREDDKILDVGCGPGLWTQMLAEHLGEKGSIVGIDGDEAQIVKARSIFNDLSFSAMRFDKISGELGRFDKVFLINSLPYCNDPAALVRQLREENLKANGKVIIRNWDQSTLLMHPLPERLIAKVKHMLCVAMEDQFADDAYERFDDNFGRKIPGILKRAGFQEVKACSQLIERCVCDDDMCLYVRANGYWMAQHVQPYLSELEFEELTSHFDPSNDRFIGKSQDFYLSIVEHTFIGSNG